MSSDENILQHILKIIKKVKLETILVGNTACALQGVPVMTQDIDFFVRDTELNREKIKEFAKLINGQIVKFDNAITNSVRVETKDAVVDFVFHLGPKQSFESVRAKSKIIKVGNVLCRVALLEEIYKSKMYYNRDKDKYVLNLIKNTIKVKNELKK